MYHKILIRFGPLWLKGHNRKLFIKKLADNLINIHDLTPEVFFDKILIPYSIENMQKLKFVCGISIYYPVIKVNSKLVEIKEAVLQLVQSKIGSFKIETKRNDKTFFKNSQELNIEIGGLVLTKTILKVDIHKPDHFIKILIEKDGTYISMEKYTGVSGFPANMNNKVLLMLSGGFDSPVAAFKLIKKGVHVDFLSFVTPPQTDQLTIDKIIKIQKQLNKYQGKSKLFLINYSKLMNIISLVSDPSYKIILMRRSFYRIATQIVWDYNYFSFANGENIGQVASQTLEAMHVIENVTPLSVLRPLLTEEKEEIINISKQIGTHSISLIRAKETCELFAPKFPIINPSLKKVKKLEHEYIDLLDLELEAQKEAKIIY